MCESDVNKRSDRIADAEAALVLRARQLFYTSGDSREAQGKFGRCDLHPPCFRNPDLPLFAVRADWIPQEVRNAPPRSSARLPLDYVNYENAGAGSTGGAGDGSGAGSGSGGCGSGSGIGLGRTSGPPATGTGSGDM